MPLDLPSVALLGALTVLAIFSSFASAQAEANCIPMSEMTSIVFQQGITQTRRRSSNVPTLQCVGNCPSDAPALLQAHCTRQGLDDNGKPTWRCVPQFAGGIEGQSSDTRRFGLGMIRVECEGCTKAGDPNIVKGSCTLRYSVTSAGGGRRDKGQRRRRGVYVNGGDHDDHHASPFDGFFILFFIVSSFFVLAALFRRCWSERNDYSAYSPQYYGNSGAATSYPVAAYDQHHPGVVMGKPVGGGAVHHHHHNHGGGGVGGFGTGMLTGFVLGDVISRSMHHGHYMHGGGGGAYEGGNTTDWGGDNGYDDGGGFDTGGFGGTDSI